MMAIRGSLSLLLLAGCLAILCSYTDGQTTPGYHTANAVQFVALKTCNSSTLYQAKLDAVVNSNTHKPVDYNYDDPIYVIDLHGSRYQMGYDYGVLVGTEMKKMYDVFFKRLLGDHWYDPILNWALGEALDWQWRSYLSKEVPSEYMTELKGMRDGGSAVGVANADKMASRILVLANMPGDLQDFIYILINEWNNSLFETFPTMKQQLQELPVKGLQCSMFGIWGSRTKDGSLYSARNLDWNKDMGIAKYKAVTVYRPTDGKYAHATLGFFGFVGALTGMSSQGITVHEANLESKEISFSGFPWALRLRYIMENSKNLDEAKTLWENTNNTVGFNHMIGSSRDAKALVEETMYKYTAYFLDDDPREQAATYTDPKTQQVTQIGFPLKEAVWRTNHGYDPVIRKYYQWSQAPTSWSMQRYMFLYHGFSYYANANLTIDANAALNMTAIVGDKGKTAYQCQDSTVGSNVLSTTYHPASNILYVSWENGTGNTWRPACCTIYVQFDMTRWWTGKAKN